jgi:hypothetical protein
MPGFQRWSISFIIILCNQKTNGGWGRCGFKACLWVQRLRNSPTPDALLTATFCCTHAYPLNALTFSTQEMLLHLPQTIQWGDKITRQQPNIVPLTLSQVRKLCSRILVFKLGKWITKTPSPSHRLSCAHPCLEHSPMKLRTQTHTKWHLEVLLSWGFT